MHKNFHSECAQEQVAAAAATPDARIIQKPVHERGIARLAGYDGAALISAITPMNSR
jgi:hypothetical protein